MRRCRLAWPLAGRRPLQPTGSLLLYFMMFVAYHYLGLLSLQQWVTSIDGYLPFWPPAYVTVLLYCSCVLLLWLNKLSLSLSRWFNGKACWSGPGVSVAVLAVRRLNSAAARDCGAHFAVCFMLVLSGASGAKSAIHDCLVLQAL